MQHIFSLVSICRVVNPTHISIKNFIFKKKMQSQHNTTQQPSNLNLQPHVLQKYINKTNKMKDKNDFRGTLMVLFPQCGLYKSKQQRLNLIKETIQYEYNNFTKKKLDFNSNISGENKTGIIFFLIFFTIFVFFCLFPSLSYTQAPYPLSLDIYNDTQQKKNQQKNCFFDRGNIITVNHAYFR